MFVISMIIHLNRSEFSKKRKTEYFYWENDFWNKSNISELTNIEL